MGNKYIFCVYLTLVAFLHIINAVILHRHLVISYSHYFSRHHMPIDMYTTNTFMYFFLRILLASLTSTHLNNIWSCPLLYKTSSSKKNSITNFLKILLSFFKACFRFCWLYTYCTISKYHSFPSASSSTQAQCAIDSQTPNLTSRTLVLAFTLNINASISRALAI